MRVARTSQGQVEAGVQLDRARQGKNGEQIVRRLTAGLDHLRDTLYRRVHSDVETKVGLDSMLIPTSEMKSALATRWEIEVYMIAAAAAAAAERWQLETPWYLAWLTRLRFGETRAEANVQARLDEYIAADADQRWLVFSDVLAHVMPESRKTPVVLLRLFAPAVQVATAVAFDDPLYAGELRNGQVEVLPVIAACHKCHGGVLHADESCDECGNPLWTFEWLQKEH